MGTTWVLSRRPIDWLKSAVMDGAISLAAALSILEEMPLGPLDLLMFSDFSTVTSSTVHSKSSGYVFMWLQSRSIREEPCDESTVRRMS